MEIDEAGIPRLLEPNGCPVHGHGCPWEHVAPEPEADEPDVPVIEEYIFVGYW